MKFNFDKKHVVDTQRSTIYEPFFIVSYTLLDARLTADDHNISPCALSLLNGIIVEIMTTKSGEFKTRVVC